MDGGVSGGGNTTEGFVASASNGFDLDAGWKAFVKFLKVQGFSKLSGPKPRLTKNFVCKLSKCLFLIGCPRNLVNGFSKWVITYNLLINGIY